jgi:hypothetical protein
MREIRENMRGLSLATLELTLDMMDPPPLIHTKHASRIKG